MNESELSEEDRKDLKNLSESFKALADSLSCTPVIYDDGKDDGTNVVRAVWAGKPISGPNLKERADAIRAAKLEEYARIGVKAFEDTEPLENVLLPGESGFMPPRTLNLGESL